ncbi:MAG: TRAP transporter substrate-binding protein [Rubrivivax sp.]|nr:TRAP transporter substrate-binding protein [Rubrivivax sp.]
MRQPLNSSRRQFVRATASAGVLASLGAPAFAQGTPLVFKWANNIPATHPSTLRVKEAADAIRAASNGRVDIQIFPNNQLGGDTDMLSQVRSGAIDIFPLSGLILQTLVPLAGINGLAFAFKDYPTVWKAMDGELGAFIREAIGKTGLHSFDRILDNGFRNITTSTKPINNAADLQGFKIRVPISPLWTSMFKAFGAAPTGINFSEVYSALQTKVVEGQENPLAIIEIAKLYEVQKYLSMTGHMWDGQWILANGKRWNSTPADVQALITKHVTDAVIKQREDIRQLNLSLETTLKGKGMVLNTPDGKSFRDVLAKAGFYAEWRAKFGDEAMAKLEKYSGKLA